MTHAAPSPLKEQSLNIISGKFHTNVNKGSQDKFRWHSIFSDKQFFEMPTTFYYQNRAQLSFTITREFLPYFILIKGLIEFSRSRDLRFSFNTDTKIFDVDLEINQLGDLSSLLMLVHGLLLKEIGFKRALKKAIQFEERYKLESAAVYDFSHLEETARIAPSHITH